MHKKTFFFALIALIVLITADAKRTRKTKRPQSEDDEDSTPQPNVVTYSNFGFNDVGGGGYDGFVPSSPDYANFLSSYNQESSTRLYAPAFPTAQDSAAYNYDSQAQDTQPYGVVDDGIPQASMSQYPQNSMSFYNTPSLDSGSPQTVGSEDIFGRNSGEVAPIYGTKLGSKSRGKPANQNNNTEFSIFSSGPSNPPEDKYSFHDVRSTYESKPTSSSSFGEPMNNYQQSFGYVQTHPTTETHDTTSTHAPMPMKFQKVIDFTDHKQYYPNSIDNKYITTSHSSPKPASSYSQDNFDINIEHPLGNNYDDNNKYSNQLKHFNDAYNKHKQMAEPPEKQISKPLTQPYTDTSGYSQNYLSLSDGKNAMKDSKQTFDYKDKFKYKPWQQTNYTNDFKNWKNPLKAFQYSTNFSNATFEFDFGGKKPHNSIHSSSSNDEVIPASSNLDLSSFHFPDPDYSNYKKVPTKEMYGDEYVNVLQPLKQSEKYDPEDYVRNLYSTSPSTATLWGNEYKHFDLSSYKHRPKKPFGDEIGDDIVHIPKRPYGKFSYSKYNSDSKPDWSFSSSIKPQKPKKSLNDWTKDISNTRYKSEEDLLGLRNHDTSHPSYLPTYRPSSNSLSADYDYKKLVEKWRQSYLKAKYKESSLNDYEGYGTEMKPLHVPVPKPYPVEVPHPVIVPVPQPYPVRIPVPKPVAVPVIRELTVPIEKPVPYAVVKKVPYPVEKLVPYRVEKEVQVPIVKPYPVPVPHIRPVFHHTRYRDREEESPGYDDEDDYMPRPESSKRIPSYAKRYKSTRTRSRRPSRASYYERNRRRWPTRRPSGFQIEPRPHRHSPTHYKNQEDFEEYENDHSDYYVYCKRTGNC